MKLDEMREKTVEELQSAIVDWKKDLFNYKLQLSTHKLENTALISKTKKLIAQAKYKKIIESNKHYKAHDENNICSEGDKVRIIESKPKSADKRWTVVEVVEKVR